MGPILVERQRPRFSGAKVLSVDPSTEQKGEAMNKIFCRYRADQSRRSFLKGAGALGLTLAGAGRARGQSASVVVINENGSVSTNTTTGAARYSFSDHLDQCLLGTLTQAELRTMYPDPAVAGFKTAGSDPNMGGVFSVVAEPAATNGRALRTKYPANHYGEIFWFAPFVSSPGTVANLSFNFRFEPGFQLNPDPNKKVAGGKIGVCIDHTALAQGATGGTRSQFWWNGNGPYFPAPVFFPIVQTSTGGELVQPRVYVTPAIVVGANYLVQIQVKGGSSGYVNFWINGTLHEAFNGNLPGTTFNGSHYFKHTGFAGGASSAYAPTVDCYTRTWNIKMWAS